MRLSGFLPARLRGCWFFASEVARLLFFYVSVIVYAGFSVSVSVCKGVFSASISVCLRVCVSVCLRVCV